MKQWKIRLLAAVILLVGVGLVGYPVVSNIMFEKRQEALANFYESTVAEISEEERSSHWEDCDNYNRALAREASAISDPFTSDLDPNTLPYAALLNLGGDGVMGTIDIPGVAGRLVIYHGTGEDVLQNGVGHLQGTSLPVGGTGTHCVLSAHCGLPSKKLFTNLDQLEKGEVFFLHIMGETLAYKVDNIAVVLPHETEGILIDPEQDYVTLVTCTPYGINSHRLLVRGIRVTYEEAKQIESVQHKKKGSTWQQQYIRAILIGLGIAFVSALAIVLIRRRRMKNKREQ